MLKKILGQGKKPKRLSIHIETPGPSHPQMLTQQQEGEKEALTIIRGTKERPGFVQAIVTLELDHDTPGDEVEIVFKAVVGSRIPVKGGNAMFTMSVSEQVLQKKRWILPVNKPTPHLIQAGTYTHQVFAIIEPSWPSSTTTAAASAAASSNNNPSEGFVQYSFQAQILKMGLTKILLPVLTTSKEFQVLNYEQPLRSGLSPSSTPHSVMMVSSKKNLPIEIAVPSDKLMFGQNVPVTIHVHPFQEGSAFEGQEVVIMETRFGIQETRHARSLNPIIKDKWIKESVEMTVPGTSMGSWPQSRNGWKRTVKVMMPKSGLEPLSTEKPRPRSRLGQKLGLGPGQGPGLGFVVGQGVKSSSSSSSGPLLMASLRSKYYDVTHQLVIALKVRTSGEKDKQAEDVEIRLDFQIIHPMPEGLDTSAEYHAVAAFSFESDEIPIFFDQMDARTEAASRSSPILLRM
ncbi:hypothetical protein BGZ58_002289 [Dissophora ornata]|nr:hypothetical protein BGZ58_002289 [Dissophora ornata]